MSLVLITSDRFADHVLPPGHPERVERAEAMQVVAGEFARRGGRRIEPRAATEAELVAVHHLDYVGLIRETAGRAVALDADTFTSPDSYDVALLAAGAIATAVEHVLDAGSESRALALVRPPGHHAERGRAMGFCLFNNIAVGASIARARGLSRVAVVDFDVHHGNGTQHTFYDDPSVLVISSHQYPFYPGSGAADESGAGAGKGFNVNFPIEAGATDADYERVYEVATSILRQFKPELLLVSMGFDAHRDDPLGGMRLTSNQFARLTALIMAVADECCRGRLVATVEGGYDLGALADSIRGVISVLEGSTSLDRLPVPTGDTRRGEAAITAARAHLGQAWKL
ncbi:MAG: histone deacetylase [Acidobacteria bacterium]|nr:histone deacetylase [Acidobacteriota bacterium]